MFEKEKISPKLKYINGGKPIKEIHVDDFKKLLKESEMATQERKRHSEVDIQKLTTPFTI